MPGHEFTGVVHSLGSVSGSELTRIADARHMHFIEQAAAFNDISLNFLRKHQP